MSTRGRSFVTLILILGFGALFFLLPGVHAQNTAGIINGSAHDSSGAAVPDADVTATNLDTSVKNTARTNADGDFTLAGLPVGSYSVTISKAGFNAFQVERTFLGGAQTRTINATLTVGNVTSQVTVEETASQVQVSTSEVSNVISQEQVAEIPLNGRNYQGLSALMPGVVNVNVGTQLGTGGRVTRNAMGINGLGTAGTLYLVDGVWNMNSGNVGDNGSAIGLRRASFSPPPIPGPTPSPIPTAAMNSSRTASLFLQRRRRQPCRVGRLVLHRIHHLPDGVFTGSAPGFFGNSKNGSIPGPGLIDFDMGLYKDFKFGDRNTVEFRSEAFNIFNHTNFNAVNTTYGSGQFGQLTGAADPRILEFALRYQF